MMGAVRTLGWTVLGLVFLDELLVMAALGVFGWSTSLKWLLVWLLPLVAMLAWYLFASPKAPYGSPLGRPLVKTVVFGLASWALWAAGHHRAALALLVFSVVINALAQLRPIRELAVASHGASHGAGRGKAHRRRAGSRSEAR